MSDQMRSAQDLSIQVGSGQVLSSQVRSDQVSAISRHIRSGQGQVMRY